MVVEKAKWLNSKKTNSISKQMIEIDVRKQCNEVHSTLPNQVFFLGDKRISISRKQDQNQNQIQNI